MSDLISSVEVERVGGHDHVRVFNRGGCAGVLIVCAGDGAVVADRLTGLMDRSDVDVILRNLSTGAEDAWSAELIAMSEEHLGPDDFEHEELFGLGYQRGFAEACTAIRKLWEGRCGS